MSSYFNYPLRRDWTVSDTAMLCINLLSKKKSGQWVFKLYNYYLTITSRWMSRYLPFETGLGSDTAMLCINLLSRKKTGQWVYKLYNYNIIITSRWIMSRYLPFETAWYWTVTLQCVVSTRSVRSHRLVSIVVWQVVRLRKEAAASMGGPSVLSQGVI